ncbi:MAG: hypothetical protein NC548_10970 [Lachnospiraceae bacterium]|nr:hypothetical protein [Lachnospiraceae bacterium]MCM1233819.1 hypothetical protein [Ruminococcus flavefaciens]
MSPKKTTLIVCAVLLVSTILIVGLLYRSNLNESSDLVARYNKNTQHFDRTTAVTVIEEVKREEKEKWWSDGFSADDNSLIPDLTEDMNPNATPTPNNMPGIPQQPQPTQGGNSQTVPPPPSSWVSCLEYTHRLFGHSGLGYCKGSTLTTGKTVRPDCSGYISAALQLANIDQGLYNSSSMHTCPALVDIRNQCNGYEDVLPGDILVYSGHVEAYAGNNRVYNWGGKKSAEDKYQGCSSHDLSGCNVDTTSSLTRAWGTVLHVLRVKGNNRV